MMNSVNDYKAGSGPVQFSLRTLDAQRMHSEYRPNNSRSCRDPSLIRRTSSLDLERLSPGPIVSINDGVKGRLSTRSSQGSDSVLDAKTYSRTPCSTPNSSWSQSAVATETCLNLDEIRTTSRVPETGSLVQQPQTAEQVNVLSKNVLVNVNVL